MNTPEFLVWALQYSCSVRAFEDGSEPERTERQLRAARALSDARREGRVFEGLAVDPPYGFDIERAMAVYGGLRLVEETCGVCAANALARADCRSLAGCFGMFVLPADARLVHDQVDNAVQQLISKGEWEESFSRTTPRWHGLWMGSPLGARQQSAVVAVLAKLDVADAEFQRGLARFKLGLETALAARLPMHVTLYPAGCVEGGWWQLIPHCPRCRGAWPGEGRQRCGICSYEGQPAPPTKRRARGRRPYLKLDRLLGADRSAEFLTRYEAFQKQQQSPDAIQTPLPPARPDNRPAD
jgi:hypothetical protein